jgi:hypothetical protein
MNPNQQTIIDFWNNERNIPFKGKLISEEAPAEGQPPTTCMCAQGQVLHLIGGKTVEEIKSLYQDMADEEVAKLLGISVAHSKLLRIVNDDREGSPQDVLSNPEKYLGPNWETVLRWWLYYESLTYDQRIECTRRCYAIDYITRDRAYDLARNAAIEVIGRDNIRAVSRALPFSSFHEVITNELIANLDDPFFLSRVVPEFDLNQN